MYGGYLRLGIPVTEIVYPYVVVGFTSIRIDADFSDGSVNASSSGSDQDFSYGLGIDADMSENISMNIEYTNYFDKNDIQFTAFSLGVVRSF